MGSDDCIDGVSKAVVWLRAGDSRRKTDAAAPCRCPRTLWRLAPILLTFLILFPQPCWSADSEDVISSKCSACTFLVKSFELGQKRTAKSHFAGGNTEWETEKLGKYANSETRLVEILESACKKSDELKADESLEKSEHKCHALLEEHEEEVENWYFHKQKSNPDLTKWLCRERLRLCCPDGHFGADCQPCPGPPSSPCHGRGHCDGAGTRGGSGRCNCDDGYQGNLCRKCANDFFFVDQNDTHVTCQRCNRACKGGCSGEGAGACVACKAGWTLLTESGCQDVDECAENPSLCSVDEICQNTVGSYDCVCQEGFKRDAGTCVPDLTAWRKQYLGGLLGPDQVLRYTAVFGLFLALCLILHRQSLLLALLFLLTLLIVWYIEFGGIISPIPPIVDQDKTTQQRKEL